MHHQPETARQSRGAAAPGDWEAMMAAAQAGDVRAYDRLLREMLPLLRATARRRLSNAADVEEAVQDTLLTIHQLRHTYEPGRPLRPWLRVICERRCVDRIRWRQRHARGELPISDAEDSIAAPSRHDAGPGKVMAAQLRALVDTLPAAQRTALTLTRFEELSLTEASRHSGLSIGSLKIACWRGVRTLRERLDAAA
ncbi:sigma-70 family RNA polymerase sigma factor [Roseomonas sp. CAU 1739]|uniref:RNA polymerase sigma factor n=1 Tax=Roseomonas sp. CAU 1739 TaxID=3140364 RepID=UPI00325A5E64